MSTKQYRLDCLRVAMETVGYTTHPVHCGDAIDQVEVICKGLRMAYRVVDIRMSGNLVGRMVVTDQYFIDKGMSVDPGVIVTKIWRPI